MTHSTKFIGLILYWFSDTYPINMPIRIGVFVMSLATEVLFGKIAKHINQ